MNEPAGQGPEEEVPLVPPGSAHHPAAPAGFVLDAEGDQEGGRQVGSQSHHSGRGPRGAAGHGEGFLEEVAHRF